MEEEEMFFNMTTFSGGFTNRQEKLYLQRSATVKSVANYMPYFRHDSSEIRRLREKPAANG